MFKILFQEPLISRNITYGKFEAGAGTNTFPYGVASVAKYVLDRGYEVKYLEPSIENMNLENYKEYIQSNQFDVIGIGSTTLQIGQTIKTFEIIKKINPKIVTVLGGIHATIMPSETLEKTDTIDYLILGEGEKPFTRLLKCIEEGNLEDIKSINGIAFKEQNNIIIKPPNFNDMLPVSELPTAAFHLFPMKKYIAQITYAKRFPSYSLVASRGCPFQCAFCNGSDVFGRKVRSKEPSQVIDEILILKKEYNAKGIIFLDSTFTMNKEWVKEFCQEYIEKEIKLPWACNSRVDTVDEPILKLMKKAGCWEILYGVESANQKSLDLLNKRTTVEQNTKVLKLSMKLGFYTYASYIICIPDETEKDALNTIKYAKRMGTPIAMFYLPVPFPKTALWYICKEKGILREDAKWEDFNSWDFSNPVYINPLIGKEKMQKLLKYAYYSYYLTPKVIFKNFKEILLFKQDIKKYIYALKGITGLMS
jgi:radical SAM superfamily enzyme YgiQ (UPF0313 family)